MDQAKIDRIGKAAFRNRIRPFKGRRKFKMPIVGFDTEYDSITAELISIQLAAHDRTLFIPWPKGARLTPGDLYLAACKVLSHAPKEIMLVTYFSLAELQFLPVRMEGLKVREFANGSLDVTFNSPSHEDWKLHVFDLARFFDRRGLYAAAESFGFGKLEYDTSKVSRENLKDKEFVKYAIHDAVLCYDITKKLQRIFMEDTGVDPLVMKTPASTSQAVYRKNFMKEETYCDNDHARQAAMWGYRGGHAEVFRRGKLGNGFVEYDLSSAYPTSVIRIGEFPIQGSWESISNWKELSRVRGGFVRIRFQFPNGEYYPFLPVDTKDGTVYPLRGETWTTTYEIKYAKECGASIEILEGYGYRKGTSSLRDYFKWAIQKRKESKGAARVMYKLLANSLTGKFVQAITSVSIETCKRIADKGNYFLDDVLALNFQELGELAYALAIPVETSIGPVFMPEWSGLITGYTRTALAQMLRTSGAVYCHTDSVWGKKKPTCDLLPFEKKIAGDVTIIRRAFGCIGNLSKARRLVKAEESMGDCLHAAIHSIWKLEAGLDMLHRFDGYDFTHKYRIKRPLKYKEAVKRFRKQKKEPGVWIKELRTGSTHWDNKRLLLDNGDTRPWLDIQEYISFQKQ